MGWDIERFPDPNQELVCCICTGVLDDPVEIHCRHIFCKECLKTWLKNRGNGFSRSGGTCPSCRAFVKHRDIRTVPPVLKNIIGKQLIYCDNRGKGCKEIPQLEYLKRHLSNCPHGEVVCENEGCKATILRKDASKHTKSCPKKKVRCEKGCNMELLFAELQDHNCIKALKSEFLTVTNALTERISKLEQQVNVLNARPERRTGSDSYQSSHDRIGSPENEASWTISHPSIPYRAANHDHVHNREDTVYDEMSPSHSPYSYTSAIEDDFYEEQRDLIDDWQHLDNSDEDEEEWW